MYRLVACHIGGSPAARGRCHHHCHVKDSQDVWSTRGELRQKYFQPLNDAAGAKVLSCARGQIEETVPGSGSERSLRQVTYASGVESPARTAFSPAIRVDGLTKRFGRVVAVEDLSLTVARGEVFGFLGPNGASNATTIRLLLGLIRPTAGSAKIFGLRCG